MASGPAEDPGGGPDRLTDTELARAVLVAVLALLGFSVAVVLVWKVRRIIGWVAIATFFAVVLNPLVDAVTRRGLRRSLATFVVFLLGVATVAGLAFVFVHPVVTAGQRFARQVPTYVSQAKRGQGRFGPLIQRYHLDTYVQSNASKLESYLSNAGATAVRTAARVAADLVALTTTLVLTFLILLETPSITGAVLAPLSDANADLARRIGRDAANAVSGYVAGNLLISVIAAVLTWITLTALGLPFATVLALWVAVADLLPLVGATIGAIPSVFIALLDSTTAAIVVVAMFVTYQQVENHFLQPVIMARTVRLSPLLVLLSVLIGVELAGFAGAILAIPAAGALQVTVRDVWDERRSRRLAAAGVVTATGAAHPPADSDPAR